MNRIAQILVCLTLATLVSSEEKRNGGGGGGGFSRVVRSNYYDDMLTRALRSNPASLHKNNNNANNKYDPDHLEMWTRSLRSYPDEMFSRSLRSPDDMWMRSLRSNDMFMRSLRSNDMLMRALRSNGGWSRMVKRSPAGEMWMRSLRSDNNNADSGVKNADDSDMWTRAF